ncbi:hypothetical protein [Sporolactobacillus vineae]|nr:hypothetical protein [Sporolactobacillus vineae]
MSQSVYFVFYHYSAVHYRAQAGEPGELRDALIALEVFEGKEDLMVGDD